MLKRVAVIGVAAVPVVALGASLHVLPARAAGSYVVTTNADAAFNEGDCTGSNTCTLRDAVMLSDGAGGTNTITFAPSVTSPIALTAGPLPVTNQALTITGNGVTATVIDGAGNNNSGIFSIVNNQCPVVHTRAPACVASPRTPRGATTGGSLTLTDATLRNGARPGGGGAVVESFAADFNATDVTFSGNSATDGNGGAITSIGNLDIRRSVFTGNSTSGNGGAIDEESDSATVSLTTSTFSHNAASGQFGSGGAVYDTLGLGGSLTITQSTFAVNTASGDGGAVAAGLQGFGAAASTIAIDNSTFTANTATGDGGAIVDWYDTATFVNDTVVGNTGGSSSAGGVSAPSNSDVGTANVTFSDDIVASNNPANCDYPTDSPTTVVTADHSFDTGTTCQFGAGNGNARSVAASALGLDAQLHDNGGPTQTIALLPGSSAIDTGGNATCQATDQRGVSRPQHGTCDVGAFEVDPTTTRVGVSQSAPGADVIVTATVTGSSSDAGVPQGSVTFTKNGATLGTASTNSEGVATFDMPVTSPNDPVFAATYTPTNGFFGSSGSTTYTPTVASIPVPATGAAPGAPAGGALVVLGVVALTLAARRRR